MKKNCFYLLCIATLCLSLAGCGGLDYAASQTYQNPAGYQIVLPDTWQILQENDTETVFGNAEGDISLTLVNDLGGVEYYSLEEINEMLAENIAANLFASYAVEDCQSQTDQCRQSYICHDAAGQGYVLDILVYRQDPAIKYYVIFCSPLQTYNEQKKLLDDIVHSFAQTADAETLYALAQQRNEAQSALENQDLENENAQE